MNAALDIHDRGLEILEPYGPTFGPGYANHGPMGVEALVALGADDAVERYARRMARSLDAQPTSGAYAARYAELGPAVRDDWRAAVAEVAARASADVWAHLGHGVIRTGHAVRALQTRDTPRRRDELARALAAWDTWSTPGDLLDASADSSTVVDALVTRAATGFATVAQQATFVRLHTVTTSVNTRRVVDVLEPDLAARVATTVTAALDRLIARPDQEVVAVPVAEPALVAAAVASGDVHEVKLADALVSELARRPADPALTSAARRQLRMLGVEVGLGAGR